MHRVWGLLKIAGWLFVVIAVLLLIVIPIVVTLAIRFSEGGLPSSTYKLLGYIEQSQRVLMQVFAGLWFFVLGSCFASFLNVVAWRMPRGKSILGSSHCPQCDVRLSFRDNLPVVGWLRNHGTCSNCKMPIPPRYIWVEVILGSIFLLLAVTTLCSGGITIPIHESFPGMGFDRVLFDPKWQLISLFAWQLLLVLFLYTLALIELDTVPPPISIFVCGLFVGIVGALILPVVHVVSFRWPFATEFPLDRFSLEQALFIVFGLMAGTVIGLIGSRSRNEENDLQKHTLLWGFVLVGLFLGWQSVLVIFGFFFLAQKFFSQKPSSALLAATVVHLLTWRWFDLLTITPN